MASGARCVRRAMMSALQQLNAVAERRPDARPYAPQSMLNSLEVDVWATSIERKTRGTLQRRDFNALIESLDWLKKVVRKARESDISDAWNMLVVREIQDL
jgi:hypothetical protein